MTITSVYLTLCCLVIRAAQTINWARVKPMRMVAMFTMDGCSSVFNLETDRLHVEMMPGGSAAMERIFGGTVARPNSFPYQAGLMLQRTDGVYWCGGSLISNEYVLTAAHCVDKAKRAMIFLGAYEIHNKNEKGQKRIEVTKRNFVIHPRWNARRLKNDIALVKLTEPISFTDRIQPIRLPMRSYEYKDLSEKLAIASGWGRHASGVHMISSVLRFVKLKIIRAETCTRSFPLAFRPTNICTSGNGKKSTCQGDSGGPLVVRKKKTKSRILIGITSFGSVFGCDKGYPAAYTKVVSYLDWIFDEIGMDSTEVMSIDERSGGIISLNMSQELSILL